MELCEKRFVMNESPTAACHASTIYRKKNGEILTAWFGGSKEGADDVGIYFSRKRGKWRFSGSRKIAGGEERHWNPCSFFRG